MEAEALQTTVRKETLVRKVTRLGVFGALAIAVSVLESMVPQPLPWSRIGFANIVILIALYLDGSVAAFVVASLKVFGGGLIMGSGFSPAFWLAFSGTYTALLVMIPLVHVPRWCCHRWISSLQHRSIVGGWSNLGGN